VKAAELDRLDRCCGRLVPGAGSSALAHGCGSRRSGDAQINVLHSTDDELLSGPTRRSSPAQLVGRCTVLTRRNANTAVPAHSQSSKSALKRCDLRRACLRPERRIFCISGPAPQAAQLQLLAQNLPGAGQNSASSAKPQIVGGYLAAAFLGERP